MDLHTGESISNYGNMSVTKQGIIIFEACNSLYAVNPSGTLKWSRSGIYRYTGHTTSGNGIVYAGKVTSWGSSNTGIYGISITDGSTVWESVEDLGNTEPLFYADQKDHLSYDDDHIRAHDALPLALYFGRIMIIVTLTSIMVLIH